MNTSLEEQKKSNLPIQEINSDYTVLERKKWVMEQYLQGRYPYEVREEYIVKYGLTKHSFDADVIWVNQQLKKRGENSIDAIIDQHTDQYRHVYKLAIEKGDYRSAINALKNIEDLYKIHKPTTGNVHLTQKTTTNYNLSNLSFDQIKELLDKTIDITPKTE